jgi:hypothetical protein
MLTAEDVQFWVDEFEDESLRGEQERFTREIGAEIEENCLRLMKEVAKCHLAICNGEKPIAFGAFDRDEIERILASDLNLYYDGYEMDLDADLDTCIDCSDAIYTTCKSTAAEEAWTRFEFIKEYKKYLETAAAFSKSIGAVPAMRLYLRAFVILDPLFPDSRLSVENAKRVVAFERIATDMLAVDYLGMKLPPFKTLKKNTGKGGRKTAKRLPAKRKGGAK